MHVTLLIFSVAISLLPLSLIFAQQPSSGSPSAPAQQGVIKANMSAENPPIPASSNPLCSNVANQIANISSMKTANYQPWEDLSWLKQNLGEAKVVNGKQNTAYMWMCKSPGNPPSMVLYFQDNVTSRVMHESMICTASTGCIGYFFERNGMNINGYKVKTELFHR